MGSVTLANSSIKGKVINKSNVKQSANVAIGKGAEANLGSIVME
jgi:hypothetical protein